jgi:hypothetical protein
MKAGDAWARVRSEILDVAGQTPEEAERSLQRRARDLLAHHVRHGRNAGYHRQPACLGPTLVVSTSGSTAAQVLVPVTEECANRGLGDNFLRTLAMSGVGPQHRHWGIEHRAPGQGHGQGQSHGVTGSSISMTWLARHCGGGALVTAATDPLDEQLRKAAGFQPDTISGSPGFLQQIARLGGGLRPPLRPALLVYGGAALAVTDAERLRAGFPGVRLTAFYPTTDAGAIGVSPADDGVYLTFSETHLVEVLDDDGRFGRRRVARRRRGDAVRRPGGADHQVPRRRPGDVPWLGEWPAAAIRHREGGRGSHRLNPHPLQRPANLGAQAGIARPFRRCRPARPCLLARRAARAAGRARHRHPSARPGRGGPSAA